jgi:hypothetical protein
MRRARSAPPRAQLPRIFALPFWPDFSRGRCATAPAHQRGWWTSGDPAEREAAVRACRTCPVLEACRSWSLYLPLSDSAIYAGLTSHQRGKLRKQQAG